MEKTNFKALSKSELVYRLENAERMFQHMIEAYRNEKDGYAAFLAYQTALEYIQKSPEEISASLLEKCKQRREEK